MALKEFLLSLRKKKWAMRRFLAILTFAALFVSSMSGLVGAQEKLVKLSPVQLKSLNVFLSDVCELGFLNFETVSSGSDEMLHLGGEEAAPDLIRFGVWHNYLNNFQESIQQTQGSQGEPRLSIDGKLVAATVKNYFGLDLKHQSVNDSDPKFVYDGALYHFEGADGEVYYHARVKTVEEAKDGLWLVRGEIYDIERDGERLGEFMAWVRPRSGGSGNGWIIERLTSAFDRY